MFLVLRKESGKVIMVLSSVLRKVMVSVLLRFVRILFI